MAVTHRGRISGALGFGIGIKWESLNVGADWGRATTIQITNKSLKPANEVLFEDVYAVKYRVYKFPYKINISDIKPALELINATNTKGTNLN